MRIRTIEPFAKPSKLRRTRAGFESVLLHFRKRQRVVQVIASEADLHTLDTRAHRMFLGAEDREYTFHLPHATPKENERLTILTNTYMNECGCSTGSLMMLIFLTASVLYYFLSGGALQSASIDDWLRLAFSVVIGAAIGKVAGLGYARWKLIRLLHHAKTLGSRVSNPQHQSLLQE